MRQVNPQTPAVQVAAVAFAGTAQAVQEAPQEPGLTLETQLPAQS